LNLKHLLKGVFVIHLLFSSLSAAVYLAWERQVKKAKDAHRVIKEAIRSERKEIDQLMRKYSLLLEKRSDVQKNSVNDALDKENPRS